MNRHLVRIRYGSLGRSRMRGGCGSAQQALCSRELSLLVGHQEAHKHRCGDRDRLRGVATVFGGDPFQRFMVERKLSMQQRRGALGVSRDGGGKPIFLRNADLLIGGEVTENRILVSIRRCGQIDVN
jgi:hypothetical protein